MSRGTLEERLAELEKQVMDLKAQIATLTRPEDWRSAVGMFAGDEGMKRIDEAGRKIREQDRHRARKATRTKRTKAKK